LSKHVSAIEEVWFHPLLGKASTVAKIKTLRKHSKRTNHEDATKTKEFLSWISRLTTVKPRELTKNKKQIPSI